ncbi:MAG: sugar phosphate isomerase/epimerase family protein [Janthinobacterium lividum]
MTDLKHFQFGVSEFTTNPWSFERDVETYARLGVQAIEVCEFKLDEARLDEQMALVAASGIEITSVQPKTRTLFPSQSQPEPLDIGERMKLFRRTIEMLAPFAPGVAFVTNTGNPPGGNMQEVIDAAAREYRELANFAADQSVRIALEPLNASIVNIETAIWTLPQAMQVVEAVRRDNFGICLDCWNVWQNANIHQEIEACGPKIFVVQISDWRTPRSFLDRLIPGQGEIPLTEFLQAVHASGFRGAYSVEIFSQGVPNALWDGDLEQVIKESRAGMEAAWRAGGSE